MTVYKPLVGLVCTFIGITFSVVGIAQQAVGVKVLDGETRLPLKDVVVSAAHCKHLTNQVGYCALPDTILYTDTITLAKFGYITEQVLFSQIRQNNKDAVVWLFPSVSLLKEVRVVANKQKHLPITTYQELVKKDIDRSSGLTFAKSLEVVKGMSSVQSGITVAKPVIHGMYGNRVLIMNNGVRQQGQQWGDDHAPELDLHTAAAVKVVKGAASVRYGSDALGGAIILESPALPYGKDALSGNLVQTYGSNGHRYVASGYVTGSIPVYKKWAWRIQGSYTNAGDRSTAAYLLNNTGMREANFSIALGWKNTIFENDLFYSHFNTHLGVFYASQMGDVDLLKERIALGAPLQVDPFSRKIDYPYQHVKHQLLRYKAKWRLPKGASIDFQYAWQRDNRNEFHLRRNNLSHIPSLSLQLHSNQWDIYWQKPYAQHWVSELGAFVGTIDNTNRPGTGVVPVIPNYVQSNLGAFALQRYKRERLAIELGLRFDNQWMNASGIDAYRRHYGGERRFNNLTYSVGVNYAFSKQFSVVSHAGVSWRAPHVYELYSNGLDHASGAYNVGDSLMHSENSYKWVTTLSHKKKHYAVSIDAYMQWINNYIYDMPTRNFMTIVSGTYPIFQYKQSHAFFRGIDAELLLQPWKQWQWKSIVSLVWANEQKTGNFFPYIPPHRWMQTLAYTQEKWRKWKDLKLAFSYKIVAKQHRFDPATDLIDVSPEAYALGAIEAECTRPFKGKKQFTFVLSIDNLFNKKYKDYTNRFRYYAHDAGRDIRLTTIFNF